MPRWEVIFSKNSWKFTAPSEKYRAVNRVHLYAFSVWKAFSLIWGSMTFVQLRCCPRACGKFSQLSDLEIWPPGDSPCWRRHMFGLYVNQSLSSCTGPQGHRDGAAIHPELISNTDSHRGADATWPVGWTENLQSNQPHRGEVTWCSIQRFRGCRNTWVNTLPVYASHKYAPIQEWKDKWHRAV